ncbi:MAG: hypothetical protein ACREJ2_07005 [Planctomycetota bacterium]
MADSAEPPAPDPAPSEEDEGSAWAAPPASPPAEPPPPGKVDSNTVRVRQQRRDELLADPVRHLRHQTALHVKPPVLSPGERAQMRRPRWWTWALVFGLAALLAGGGVMLVNSSWLAPKVPPPPAVAPIVLHPAASAEPTPQPSPPSERPPAFVPLTLDFAAPDAAAAFRRATVGTASQVPATTPDAPATTPDAPATIALPSGAQVTGGTLVEPARPDGTVTWLAERFPGDLELEFDIAVEALPGAEPDAAREFCIVFGDGPGSVAGIHFRIPSQIGQNCADVLDATGQVGASYGHTRFGWPFLQGVHYRVKVIRLGDHWMVSRDGVAVFGLLHSAAGLERIGYIPVSGATIRLIRVSPR